MFQLAPLIGLCLKFNIALENLCQQTLCPLNPFQMSCWGLSLSHASSPVLHDFFSVWSILFNL
jgi:hypothetical protein